MDLLEFDSGAERVKGLIESAMTGAIWQDSTGRKPKPILATRGKVFTLKTLDALIAHTRLREFRTS